MRFDTQSTYGWQNMRRRDFMRVPQSRRLRWWILVAVLFSIIVHVMLFVYFGDLHLKGIFTPGNIAPQDRAIPVIRTEIDPSTLLPPEDGLTEQQPDNAIDIAQLEHESLPDEVIDEKIDLLELQEMIPDEREIEFSPQFTQPMNISPAVNEAAAAALLTDSMKAIENVSVADKQDAKNALDAQMAMAPAASEKQMAIDMAATESAISDQKDMMDKIRNTADSQGNGASLDGFATLDQLIKVPGGRLTDASKPIYMPTDLLFEFNQFQLRDSAKTSLMMLGVLIDRNPETIFVIEGHTDTIGTHQSNFELSRKRAAAVRDWLIESLLIKPERIRIDAAGETRPIVNPAGTAEQQRANRRVEIRTVKAGGGVDPLATPLPVRRAKPVAEPDPPIRRAVPVKP